MVAQPVTAHITDRCAKPTVVDAGHDLSACMETPGITLSGSVSGGSSTGIWSTTGDGSFNRNAVAINAVYRPGPADIQARKVELVLTSAGCGQVTDRMVIHFMPLPIVEADGPMVQENGIIVLKGHADEGSVLDWHTTATGEFVMDRNSAETMFRADPKGSAQQALFIFQARNGCGIATDTVRVRSH